MTGSPQLPLPLQGGSSPSSPVFLVGDSNRDAFDLVMAPSRWPGHALSLCGPPASGKTTLARLWAWQTGAQFVRAQALSAERLDGLGEGPVVVDDLEHMADPEAVFFLYNRLTGAQRPLLLVSEMPAGQIDTPLTDLRTRLRAVPVAAIGRPDEDLIRALLARLFEERQLPVGPQLISYISARMERTGLCATTLVERLDAAALAAARPVSRDMASEILQELETGRDD